MLPGPILEQCKLSVFHFSTTLYFSHEVYHNSHKPELHINGVLSTALHKMVNECYVDPNLMFTQYMASTC